MTPTWRSEDEPDPVRITGLGWVRVALKGLLVGLVTFGGLALMLVLRLIEAPLFAPRRPVTPYITVGVCKAALFVIGLRHHILGRPMAEGGGLVANHGSWLDIFTLNACERLYFVSKAEVAVWPGIGWLARATGTVFISRDARDAAKQSAMFEERLKAGHRLLFFPEGTSTDGQRVLPFKSTLFAAFFSPDLGPNLHVQPISVVYEAPPGQDPRFYGWWGDMEFGAHLAKVLAAPRQGRVTVTFHDPVSVAEAGDRKALAVSLENHVRSGFAANKP
ncbi:MAG: lysophospholipid acyltransferase family protein [Pseudomonadota bacterium]